MRVYRHLKLRIGTQVMLLTNLAPTNGLVNGSRGVVVEFVSAKTVDLREPGDRERLGNLGSLQSQVAS